MSTKTVMVSVRVEPEQQHKLRMVSRQTNKPGNLSTALRYLIDTAHTPTLPAGESSTDFDTMPEPAK